MITIGVDGAGGDNAPDNPIQGILNALKIREDIIIRLYGPKQYKRMANHDRITFIEAPDVITMSDAPVHAFRTKKKSSIHIGLDDLKSGEIDGFISAGNTGAVMTAAMFIIGRIPSVDRPAIATVLPGDVGPVILLDVGSTVDSKSTHLNQFAVMGHFFAKNCLNIASPTVGLLNIGEEDEKGNQVTQDAFKQLRDNMAIKFIGNIEGRYILSGQADIIVCDGFIGNVILKFGEGVANTFFSFFKTAITSFRFKLGAALLAPVFRQLKNKYHYDNYGSAPLLGINAPVFIAHGSSSPAALCSGILAVATAIDNHMIDKITTAVSGL